MDGWDFSVFPPRIAGYDVGRRADGTVEAEPLYWEALRLYDHTAYATLQRDPKATQRDPDSPATKRDKLNLALAQKRKK